MNAVKTFKKNSIVFKNEARYPKELCEEIYMYENLWNVWIC